MARQQRYVLERVSAASPADALRQRDRDHRAKRAYYDRCLHAVEPKSRGGVRDTLSLYAMACASGSRSRAHARLRASFIHRGRLPCLIVTVFPSTVGALRSSFEAGLHSSAAAAIRVAKIPTITSTFLHHLCRYIADCSPH